MKKIKILLASALVFTSVFSAGIQNAHADSKESASTVENSVQAKDKTASVELEGNPTTGYTWEYEIENTSIADLAGKNYASSDSTGELCGAGGTYTWYFAGLKEGKTEVTFKYLRPWETEVLESKTYVINVDSDLNVTITEKTPEDSTSLSADTTITNSNTASNTDSAAYTAADKYNSTTSSACTITDTDSSNASGTDVTSTNSSNASSTDISDTDNSITSGSAVVYVVEIKDGNVKKYTKNINADEFKKHFDEVSSYIDEMIKKQQEEMNRFFDLFKWNF
ncbi:MAG: protease inhibitor I42 family protein [Clostridium sp.]